MIDPLNVRRNDEPANIANLWAPNPAFLICGGPSINDFPTEKLRDRGVMSMAVNQVAAWVPTRAWCFSDPQNKFHHALFLDPAIMTFSPNPKLRHKIYIKTEEGFRRTEIRVRDCPNTFGFERQTCFVPRTFYTDKWAHWGPGSGQPEEERGVKKQGCLCTMMLGLRLLNYLGVKTIYLVGVDFVGRDGMCYGFPSQKKERNKRYRWEGWMLEQLKPEMAKRGIEVFNCNPQSNCFLFPYRRWEDALEDCKGSVGEEPLDTVGWYSKSKTKEEVQRHDPFTPRHFSVS
jgi:hypothetical protein